LPRITRVDRHGAVLRVAFSKMNLTSYDFVGLGYVVYTCENHLITFLVNRRRREMYCGHARLCVCVSVCLYLFVRGRMPTLLHGSGCNLGGVVGDAR